jgi:LuxR family maltose regulon positive regulatory protein
MSTTLLKTKLYIPPIRSELVSRPRLIERLDEGFRQGCKLTLVSAPAGYGKTTLLGEQFLSLVLGLRLSAEDIAALERRTEGWVAGLQMAAISMRGRDDIAGFVQAFAGSHRYILDYLGEEVLRQQARDVREFLLQTAILDRLSGELCDAMIGASGPAEDRSIVDSQSVLEYLEHNNLFIVPLDDVRQWYRYHRLFADLLRQRLQREKPELVPELHRRASE